MEKLEEYSAENLQKFSYRFLQQTAKALSLPSNVKKVYLIQLIHAKKYCSREHVDKLVRQVRLERQQLALVRKRAKNKKKHILQSTAISSTSNSKSPPISVTPKRVTQIMVRYSPDQYLLPKKYTNRQIIKTVGQTTVSASDRVLRSRTARNPSFVLNNRVTTVRKEDKYQQVNMLSLLKERSLEWRSGNEMIPKTRATWKCGEIIPVCSQSAVNMSPQPVRQQRRLSGIYPLNEESQTPNRPIVSVRRADGSLSKLNAYYIHKSLTQNCHRDQELQPLYNQGNQDSESQSILSIESSENTNTLSTISITDNFSNTVSNLSLDMSSETSLSYENTEENMSTYKENQGEYTVYYHKKIRAEQVRCLRSKEVGRSAGQECRLPKINDVFSKFSDVYVRDVTQPVYIQVENNPEIASNPPLLYSDLPSYQTTMLEKLYNLRHTLVSQPLPLVLTTSHTRCVYSTPVICTAKPQPSAARPLTALYNIPAMSADNSQYTEIPQRQDLAFHYEVASTTNTMLPTELSFWRPDDTGRQNDSSVGSGSPRTQELGANVTIPEMVEDALELISQDGDYMERMGMDMRLQCVLCEWAGPKIILEYHIRNEHGGEIIQSEGGEWCATYTLGALASGRQWLSRVLEHSARLYVVSAKYEDPDCFCATLSTISNEDDLPETGSITTYNKVTGEPFTWKGFIQSLPPTLTSDHDPPCLKLELSRLNLLPNSANLKLLNRELVVRSPTKVVVGQPELDNIQIMLIVKLYD